MIYSFPAWAVMIVFLLLVLLCFASFALADNDTDRLRDKQVDFFASLDCSDPNAIVGFKWNFSPEKTQEEQCKIYQFASKFLQLSRVMENHTTD
jgi:hypothetical protein